MGEDGGTEREAPVAVEYVGGTPVLIVADGGGEDARRSAELAGLRPLGVAPLAAGAERIDRQLAPPLLLVEAGADAGESLEAVLDRLAMHAAEEMGGAVLLFPAALIDRIAARGLADGIEYLCDPDEAERVAALLRAARPLSPMLNDVNKGHAAARLQQLSEEVARIASVLASLSEDEATVSATAAAIDPEAEDAQPLEAGQIRALIRARRLRDHFFHRELFADPAWDMLLDLMAARIERQRVAVSSLCIAAAVPPTTALRWIKALCDQGLFVRVADPEDGRRVFIELADDAAQRMEAYLKTVLRISPFGA